MITRFFENIYHLLFSKLAKNLSVIFSGNVVSSIFNFIGSIIILKNATTENIGILYPLVGIMLMSGSISDLGFSTIFIKLGCSQEYFDKKKFKEIFNSVFGFKFLSGAVAALGCLIFAEQISLKTFNNITNAYYIRMITLGVIFHAMSSFYYSYLQIRQNIRGMFLARLIPTILKFSALCTLFLLNKMSLVNLVWVFMLYPIASVLLPAMFYVPAREYSLASFKWQAVNKTFYYSKWIAITGFINSALGQTDTLMLSYFSGASEVQYLVGAQKLSSPLPLITISMATLVLPKVSSVKTYRELNYIFRKASLFLPVILVATLIAVPISPFLIELILGSKYVNSINAFQFYLAGGLLSLFITPVSTIIYKLNKEPFFIVLNIVQLLANITLNYFLIPSYGATGASFATFSAKVIGLILILAFLLKCGILDKGRFDEEI